MIALKTSAIVATIVTSLTPSAIACLELKGSMSSTLYTQGNMVAIDNGVQTCSGDIDSGDQNLSALPLEGLVSIFTNSSSKAVTAATR